MSSKIEIVTSIPGYKTGADAISGTNSCSTVKPATYYIYKQSFFAGEVDGKAINVTSVEGVEGVWINASDNVKPDNIVIANTFQIDQIESPMSSSTAQTYTDAISQAALSSPVNDSSNKKVYSPHKDKILCYIINSLISEAIEFECEPEEISDNNSAQFDAQEVRGRSSPYQGYNNSGPREISFSVMLHDDLCKSGILATVNKLRSLVYPNYDGVLLAPICEIRVGNMIHCSAIVTNVSVTWQKPFRDDVYVAANVDISATEVVDRAYSATDIWSKGGYI